MKLIAKILLIATLMGLMACNDSEYRGPSASLCTTMVTYKGERAGYGLLFSYTMEEQGSDHTVNLWSHASFKEEIPAGTRLVINYRYAEGAGFPDDGLIEIISAQKAHTATLSSVDAAPALAPIGVTALVRSGVYIDLWCRLPMATGRTFSFDVDAATVGTANPVVYISTTIPDDATPGYDTNYAASFDASELWDNPATTTLTVKINNSNNPRYSTFNFTK